MTIDKQKAVFAVCDMLQEMAAQRQMEQGTLVDFVTGAVDADVAYMQQAGVLEGDADVYYDDDEAFDYIVNRLAEQGGLSEEAALDMAELVDSYMEAMEQFMDDEGVLDWS
nr:hypothetical protein [Maliibacterium massiliense]